MHVETRVERTAGAGVPQGSVLGPILWNVLYDDTMDLELEADLTLMCYVDDLAVVVTGATVAEVEREGNDTLEKIARWMRANKLRLAPQKTKRISLTCKRKVPKFTLEGHGVRNVRECKYLGVTLDYGLTFSAHVKAVTEKAKKLVRALGVILPNMEGPSQMKRRMLSHAVQSVVLYGGTVWGRALRIKSCEMAAARIQRGMALRVCSGYTTVSTEAALVVAGLIPSGLLIEERRTMAESGEAGEESRRRARRSTVRIWEKRWKRQTGVAAWTKRLIRNLEEWHFRGWGQVNYHITQFMTGHGSFGTFLKRIGRVVEDQCVHCGEGPDDPEHTFFLCPRWGEKRWEMNTRLEEEATVENVVSQMVKSREAWAAVERFVGAVLRKKEEAERIRDQTRNLNN